MTRVYGLAYDSGMMNPTIDTTRTARLVSGLEAQLRKTCPSAVGFSVTPAATAAVRSQWERSVDAIADWLEVVVPAESSGLVTFDRDAFLLNCEPSSRRNLIAYDEDDRAAFARRVCR